MPERLSGWKVGDQVFPTLREAENAEGRQDLIDWFQLQFGGIDNSQNLWEVTTDTILADSTNFVNLLRRAGVLLIDRKPKVKKAPKVRPPDAEPPGAAL